MGHMVLTQQTSLMLDTFFHDSVCAHVRVCLGVCEWVNKFSCLFRGFFCIRFVFRTEKYIRTRHWYFLFFIRTEQFINELWIFSPKHTRFSICLYAQCKVSGPNLKWLWFSFLHYVLRPPFQFILHFIGVTGPAKRFLGGIFCLLGFFC